MLQTVKELLGSLPPGASTFLKRAVGLFIAWKLFYILLFQPLGEPDGWLVRMLGEATVSTLNLFIGEERFRVWHTLSPTDADSAVYEACAVVYRTGMQSDVGIYAPCNGLELMVLSVGFILCFEGPARRKSLYVLAALFGVFLVNVLRCSLLTVIKTGHPAYFEFSHKYLFNIAGYSFVFLIWMHYVNGIMGSSPSAQEIQSRLGDHS
jgi:exosortase/archaeosortase family protein